MDVTLSELLASFMESPLVLWVRMLGPLGSEERVAMFMELVDGVFLHKVMTHIDPNPTNQRLNKNVNNDVSLRLYNLTVLTRHIRTYYQETLQQLVVMPPPNILLIANDPMSVGSMEELKRLLLLLLGCAVQSERKEEMIDKIKLLDIQTQAAIVSHIQEVTQNPLNVLDLSWMEEGAELVPGELEPLSRNMAASLQQLIDQRDKATEAILDLTLERDYLSDQRPPEGGGKPGRAPKNGGPAGTEPTQEEKQHLAVELADAKAKLRRYRQELEEKTEQLMDSKHEAERLDQELQKLKQENQSLSCEARSVRAYRDEVDALRERAARVDRLEAELSRCKERLNDVHFYKTRMEELRDDNTTLLETKVLLEEQLAAARGRCDKLHTLEKDNLLLRAKIHDLEMEREGERRRLEELLEENLLLELGQKQSMNESAHLGWELEQLSKNHDGPASESRKSLVHELNEGVSSRVLKLEKENRELQASVERLKEENQLLQEQQLHTQELDRENQSLSNKLNRLQVLLDQEKLTNQDMESLGEELLKEKQNLEREMHALRADKDRQISELQSEQQHLSEAVKALQERAQSSSEARVREAEAKNRLLHQSVTDAGSRLASLEAQLKVVSEEAECLRERAGRCEEVQREAARLERSREALTREVATLRSCSQHAEALERQVTSLQQEALRLRREAEEAQKELQRLAQQEAQNSLLSMENLELRRSMENLRSSSARLPTLQEELQEAQRETQEAQRSVEEAREKAQGERKRAERLELNLLALNQEKQQLQEQLERSREEKLEADGRARENRRREEELSREVEDLKQERRRREEAEEERRKLQLDLEQAERSRKQLEKENLRVRTLQEAKELELEETASLASASLKEAATLKRELERLEEASAKAKELERENKELQKEATIDKKTLDTLREELVSEKLKAQQQNLELERLDKELERIELSQEKLLQQEQTLEDEEDRSPDLNVRRTLKEEIGGLERKLEESNALNESLRRQLTAQQKDSSQHASVRGAAPELLRFQDHLIAVEKSNASLQTESSLLKEQLKQLEGQNSSLNSQMAALQRHASTLQEHNAGLHTQTAKLQVDISAVSSQSASLMAQNAVLQGQVGALEAEAESWQRQRDEAWRARESALADHERLLSVHERQAREYEQLIGQHAVLKGQQRALEGEHRALHCKYQALLQLKDRWEEQQEAQQLKQEVQKNRLLQQENLQLKSEVDRLTQNQTQHAEQNQNLQQRLNELKNSLSSAQQEVSQWTARYDSLVDQNQNLDLSMTKLDNHCELLSRLKGNLEEENHHLLSQIHLLGQQNQTLLERSLESKEQFHQEHKLYIDKLNALRRQKEKLEEKIMDQYKFYDPTPKKRSQWSGARALVKLIKPRKENGRDQNQNRERARSAPDIPLPATPPPLPPEAQPPVPRRTGSDSLSNHSNRSSSPGRTAPPSRGPAERGGHRSSSDSINGDEANGPIHRSHPSSTPNRASGTDTAATRRTRTRCVPDPESVVPGFFDEDLVFGGRPGSGDFSHNTSGSSSPVTCREAFDRPRHSTSLSSDDVMFLSQSQHSLSRSSTLPYDHAPQRAQPQRGGGARTKPRPGSPGSEMVTLEEFLEESNLLSPPMLSTGGADELMADYFSRSPAPSAASARDQATPTSYVSPTVHSANQRPGQSVKPSPRQPAGQSLSRTFSLASADLLRSQGPDGYRGNEADGAPRRQGGGGAQRERPLSARFATTDLQSPAVRHSPSLNLQTERGRSHRGEVAMVTPVRAAQPDPDPEGGGAPTEGRPSDSAHPNKDGVLSGSSERPKSTPASPDPNNDPQTVWYEYGCV
ncbi:protein Daple-like isoform X3 [Xiphophorus maculatus]|uniref:Coiled-coil domain containing 88C n=1 Tax=Xiphophorus maculatus TaxID=8083 RepID=M3ZD61_XIPMA|nr:protein Daple-like isoform X3 [Xiphophorus maculatus]